MKEYLSDKKYNILNATTAEVALHEMIDAFEWIEGQVTTNSVKILEMRQKKSTIKYEISQYVKKVEKQQIRDINIIDEMKGKRVALIRKLIQSNEQKKNTLRQMESGDLESMSKIVNLSAIGECRDIANGIMNTADSHDPEYYIEGLENECFNLKTKIIKEYEKMKSNALYNMNNKIKHIDEEMNKMIGKDKKERDDFISFLLLDEEILSKFKEFNSKRILFESYKYENYKELPELYDLGNISLSIPGIITSFESYEKCCSEWKKLGIISKENQIKLPLVVKRREGYSIALPCLDVDEVTSFVLRNSMKFPVGKMTFTTVIAQSANVFGPLHTLKRQETYLSGGMNYRETEQIEAKIKEINNHVEYVNNHYFNSVDLREKNVPAQTLLIYGYNKGISKKASEYIDDMIKFAPQNGVNIVFFYENLNQLSSEIKKNSLVVKIKKGHYGDSEYYIDFSGKEYLYDIGEVLTMREYEKIIDCMSEYIGEDKEIKYSFGDLIPKWRDINTYCMGGDTSRGIDVPIAYVGTSKFYWVVGKDGDDDRHHTLIDGATGNGKTELLHTMIMSLMYKYSADELQVCLMDYKEGVGEQYFVNNAYTKRIVAQGDRSGGLGVLREMVQEMNTRYNEYKKNLVEDLYDFREKTGKKMPRLIVVIEELSGLTGRKDNISCEAIESIAEISQRGRAAGIHLILTSQTFENTGLSSDIQLNFAHRFSCIGNGNCEYTYKKRGSVNGFTSMLDTIFVKNSIVEFLEIISKFSTVMTEAGNGEKRVISSLISDHINNQLNNFEIENTNKNQCVLNIGYNYEEDEGKIVLTKENSSVLLVCPEKNSEGTMVSNSCDVFTYMILSILQNNLFKYDVTHEKSQISLFAIEPSNRYIQELEKTRIPFADCVQYIYADGNEDDSVFEEHIEKIKHFIKESYQLYVNRKSDLVSNEVPKFLMVYGLHRLQQLQEETSDFDFNVMVNNGESGLSYLDMLKELIIHGGSQNIFVIAWADENYSKAAKLFKTDNVIDMFTTVIASAMKDKMEELVYYSGDKANSENVAIIKRKRRTVYREISLFQMPSIEWIDSFREKYDQILKR